MMANSAQLLNSIAQMEKNVMPRYRFASSYTTPGRSMLASTRDRPLTKTKHAITVSYQAAVYVAVLEDSIKFHRRVVQATWELHLVLGAQGRPEEQRRRHCPVEAHLRMKTLPSPEVRRRNSCCSHSGRSCLQRHHITAQETVPAQ